MILVEKILTDNSLKDKVFDEKDYGKSLIEILIQEYPEGFNEPNIIYVNNKIIKVEEYGDIILKKNDVVIIIFHEKFFLEVGYLIAGALGLFGTTAAIAAFVINVAVAVALSYAINKLFGPEVPDSSIFNDGKIANGSPSYTLNNSQNKYRIGEKIPSIYGRVRTYPSLIAPPYRVFKDNQQYLYLLMAIGQGEYILNKDDIYVSNTRVSDLENDVIDWKLIKASDVPRETNIEAIINDDDYKQIIYTSPEVSDIVVTNKISFSNYNAHFDGMYLRFGTDKNGNFPDLITLDVGDDFEIRGSKSNDTPVNEPLKVKTIDNVNKVLTFYNAIFHKEGDECFDRNTPYCTCRKFLEGYEEIGSCEMRPNGESTLAFTQDWIEEFGDFVFNPEPTYTVTNPYFYSGRKSDTSKNYYYDNTVDNIFDESYIDDGNNEIYDYPLKKGDVITIDNNGFQEDYEITIDAYWIESEKNEGQRVATFKVDRIIFPEVKYTLSTTITQKYSYCNFGFARRQGQYNVNPIGTEAQYVEVDFTFPNGLYRLTDQSETISRTINIDVEVETEDGATQTVRTEFTNGTKRGAYRVSKRYPVHSPLRVAKISFSRVTPEQDDIKFQDECHVTAIKSPIVAYGDNDYGDITLLWIKAKASNTLSSQSQFQINAWVERTDVANNINSVIEDIYTNNTYGANLDVEDLDLCDDDGIRFNGSFEGDATLLDCVRKVGRVGKISAFPSGSQIRTVKEDKRIRTTIFNETNIIKDSLEINYLFGKNGNKDGYRVNYRDPLSFKEKYVTFPENSLNPQIENLFGCTDSAIALSEAKYRYYADLRRRKTVSFQTDYQGFIPDFLDRIGVSHKIFTSGEANVVAKKISNSEIRLRNKIKDGYTHIMFIKENGDITDMIEFTKIGEYNITLTYPTNEVFDIFDTNGEATKCALGTADDIVEDFIVTKTTPNGEGKVSIEGLQYDETVYED